MLHLTIYNAIVVLKLFQRNIKKGYNCLHQMAMLLFHQTLHNSDYIIINGQKNKFGELLEYYIEMEIFKYRKM